MALGLLCICVSCYGSGFVVSCWTGEMEETVIFLRTEFNQLFHF